MTSFIVSECLHAFKKVNEENLPDRIIMFRDGVGEGQLKYVYDTELDEIKVLYLRMSIDSVIRSCIKINVFSV